MGDGFASACAQGLVFVFVVGPLLAWLKSKARRERQTKSLNCFTLKTPQTYRHLFLGVALIFEVLMLIVYVYSGLSFGDWQVEFLWLGHAFALVALMIWLVATLQKLDVDGEVLRYRTICGRHRQTTFGDIDRVTMTNQGMLVSLYAKGRRFASLSGDVTCLSNLFSRCEKEGIPVALRESRPITLWSLYRSAMAVILGICAGVSVLLAVVVVVMVVAQTQPPTLLLGIVPICLLLTVLIIGICSVVPLRGISQIKRQEQLLDFSFVREMVKRNARGAFYVDEDWFVAVSNCNIVAFRRDYLVRVGASRKTESGDECQIGVFDGATHKVRAAAPLLKRLRSWFDEGMSDA